MTQWLYKQHDNMIHIDACQYKYFSSGFGTQIYITEIFIFINIHMYTQLYFTKELLWIIIRHISSD